MWDRLLGCFGDALLRKFGAQPPQEWVGAIGVLNDPQIERGMRRVLFGWKGGPPNLPDFMRLCRAIGTDEFEEGPKTLALPNPDNWLGDKWDIASNQRLMSYLMRKIVERTNVFGPPNSPEMKRVTDIFVGYKKRWADLMRNWDHDRETGEIIDPPMEDQNASWAGLIESAEEEIAKREAYT